MRKSSLLDTAALLSKGTVPALEMVLLVLMEVFEKRWRISREKYGQHLEDKDILETAWRTYSNAALKHILTIAYNLRKKRPDASNLGEILTNGVHFPNLPTFEVGSFGFLLLFFPTQSPLNADDG
jgi:hypothetical protein